MRFKNQAQTYYSNHSKQYSKMCFENNYHVENECNHRSNHKKTYRKMCLTNTYSIENEYKNGFGYRNSQLVRKRKIEKEKSTIKIDTENYSDDIGKNLQTGTQATNKYFSCAGATAGAINIVASTTTGINVSESYNQEYHVDRFDHILQKDTPINNMIFFSAHNAGALVGHGTIPLIANQTMTVKEILENTPVRFFDFDIYEHNGELVVLHSKFLDPVTADADITKFKDVLNDINDWQEKNPTEVIFFNIENHGAGIYNEVINLISSIFQEKYTTGIERIFFDNDLTIPTIRDISNMGIKIVIPVSIYESAGHANLEFLDPKNIYSNFERMGASYLIDHYFGDDYDAHNDFWLRVYLEDQLFHVRKDLSMPNIWEDRTITKYLYKLHPEIAGQLKTEDIDQIIASKKGCVISLDHLTPNDPRFFKPEDRETFNLNPDIEAFNHNFHGKTTDSVLTGIGVFTAGASISLSAIISIFYGYTNEIQIRKQSKVISQELSKIEIGEILAARPKSSELNIEDSEELLPVSITVDELKEVYKKNQIFKIIKSTALPGANATTSISTSLLSLGLIYPPLILTFSSTAIAFGSIGISSTLLFTALNAYRLGKSIDGTFELPQVKSNLEKRVTSMNQTINNKIEDSDVVDPTDLKPIFDKMIQDSEVTNQLVGASTIVTATSLISRITGFAKYSLPIIGSISAGVCAVASIFSTSILSTINFKERRKKLENISTAVINQIIPDPTRKSKLKLGIFGKTAIESFIEKDHANLLQLLNLSEETSFKDAFCELLLLKNSMILDKYIEEFSYQEWQKDLTNTAKELYQIEDFSVIRKSKKHLHIVFKKYMQEQIEKFASRNTWITGTLGAINIISVGYFSGMLFLPFVGMLFPVVGIPAGGIITKLTSMREAKLFVTRFKHIIDSNYDELNREDLRHRKELDFLLLKWEKLFYQPSSNYMETKV